MIKNKLSIALIMVILMFAGTITALPVTAADDSAPVVYSWDTTIACTPEGWTAWQNWAKQFYPDIVNFIAPKSAGGWGSYVNKVVLSATTKERWDAVPSGVARFAAEWSIAGVVRPVEDLLNKANATNLKAMIAANPDWKAAWTYKGKLYGIPYGGKPAADTETWVWRSDVLKKCGFSSPPKTIAALEQFCAAVKKNYPTMVPLGQTLGQLMTALNTPVGGIKGRNYAVRKDGVATYVRFVESFQWPVLQEMHKFYAKGWVSSDVNVAWAKQGIDYQLQAFMGGRVAVSNIDIGASKRWGDVIAEVRKIHPAWNPILAKNFFSGPKGTGRTNNPGDGYWTNEQAVMFSATDIGNEAAQIRLVKYLDWMWNPKNLWWAIPSQIGPNGWAATYKIDTKANKVQILTSVAKTGFGNKAGSMGMWLADDWARVEKIPANASAGVKIAEQIRKACAQMPKGMIKNIWMPEVTVPGLVEKYPAANGAGFGGTFEKLVQDVTKNDTQLLAAYRDWIDQCDKAGLFKMNDETFKLMKTTMGDDFAKAQTIINYEK